MGRKYWEEIRGRATAEAMLSDWEREREEFFRERGMDLSRLEMREGRERWILEKKDRALQREERWQRVEGSRYNKWMTGE